RVTCTTWRSPRKHRTTGCSDAREAEFMTATSSNAAAPLPEIQPPPARAQAAPDIHRDRILILDFGSQYTQLIARRVREIGVYCEIHPYTITADAIRAFAPKGIILSGGPESALEAPLIRAPDSVFELACPLLGICYGMQTMAIQ